MLKLKTVDAKKYGREAMINNAMLSWNDIQNTISSHVLLDLSSSKLKSLLAKQFQETYSNDWILLNNSYSNDWI